MNYVGIDIHKKYSVLCAQDERGTKLREARIAASSQEAYRRFFASLEGPSKAVLEACWNWGLTHDLIEELAEVKEVVLAHPYKTRLIAEAQIKNDRLDAAALATLLRGNFVARVHVPAKPTRARKHLLRQRLCWARLRTRLRNRIHSIIDRQAGLDLPQCSDLFGARGLSFLREVELGKPDGTLLQEALLVHDLLSQQIKAQEKRISAEFKLDPNYDLLLSVPGIGKTIAAVLSAEIEDITRFSSPEKLCAYAGVVPSTFASGEKLYQGRLLPYCNKWLRWGLIEASWVAISCSSYFGALYRRQRARGKKPNTAITIVARRMCRILYCLLKEKRSFEKRALYERNSFVPGCSD
jgi:transposase